MMRLFTREKTVRFFVEITEVEANKLEENGSAFVIQGSSGGDIHLTSRPDSWILMETKGIYDEVYSALPPEYKEITPKKAFKRASIV
jgi:hypothetical protein